MKYLVVDDERIVLEGMAQSLRNVIGFDGGEIFTSMNPYEAITIAQKEQVNMAFCDVDMPGMNGLKLAAELHNVCPDVDIVFATGYAHYSLDAWKTEAKDFILKPVGEDEIKQVIDKLLKLRQHEVEKVQHMMEETGGAEASGSNKLKVMCFGNFEVSYKGKPVHFTRKKSKEMFAYLVDRRGAMISTDEIRTILWEEDVDTEEKKGYVRVLANDIKKNLELIGINDFLINGQDCYSIDTSRIECDYFDFMDQKKDADKLFQDEYMVQYSWGESTLARLLNMRD